MRNKQTGAVLAIVLMCLSVMLIMIYVLAQSVTTQQKATVNYNDMKLAENYAKEALLYGEGQLYYFESEFQLENPPIKCEDAAKNLSGSHNGASCLMLRRAWQLQHLDSSINLNDTGKLCGYGAINKLRGICYRPLDSSIRYDSDLSWRPWLLDSESSPATQPCSSYLGKVLLIDDATSRYSISYDVNNKLLCTNPRIMIEPINLDYHGNYVRVVESWRTWESDTFTQANGAIMTTYMLKESLDYRYHDGESVASFDYDRLPILSPRLYRITAVAFGRSGLTRVALQEIVMITTDSGNPRPEYRRLSNDSPDNLAYRIVRISTKRLN